MSGPELSKLRTDSNERLFQYGFGLRFVAHDRHDYPK